MIVDSHCHLHMVDLDPFEGNLSVVVDQAKVEGVATLLTVAVDEASSQQAVDIAEQFDQVFASSGIHPSESPERDIDWSLINKLAEHNKVIAIGETGLDYYYNDSGLDIQRERFRQHVRLARDVNKPLIIHSRSAVKDTIDILTEEQASEVSGVMHCFTESWEMAQQAMDLGFYISFSGIVTFKNAKTVAEVARQVPLERLLIETDAPYLTPVPYRGKPNYPKYVRQVAEKIAELKQLSFEEVAKTTTDNFMTLFKV